MAENEVLVVASKVKNYIRAKGDMKTSSAVLEVLSDRIRSCLLYTSPSPRDRS